MFRHLDFSLMEVAGNANILAECGDCGHLFRVMDGEHREVLEELYQSTEYAEHKEARVVRQGGAEVHAAVAQARVVLQQLGDTRPPGILDIGCFDGALLGAFENEGYGGRLVGFDVEERLAFKDHCTGEFTTGPLDEIQGSFGLILLSQSLMYIRDLTGLFAEIDRLLAPGGSLFVHVPDILQKPPMILLADQHHYFTKGKLGALLARNGFVPEFLENTPFPRDLLALSRKGKTGNLPTETVLPTLASSLDTTAGCWQELAGGLDGYTILGTTMEAAFAHSLEPGKTTAFVDEDPHKVGGLFQGLPVLHPSSLQAGQHCILPLGQSALPLLLRFETQYPGTFHLLEAGLRTVA